MTLAFSPLPCPDSWLQRLDPRWKLAAVLLTLVAVALLHTLLATTIALLGALLLAATAHLPARWFCARLGLAVLFLAPFVLTLPLLTPDGQSGSDGPLLSFSWSGARLALTLTVKALTLVTLALVLLTTAPVGATLQAAQSLRVPGLLVRLLGLAYRYVFLLAEELARLRVALRVRGYRNRPDGHSYRTVGRVVGTLLVRGHERGERVGQAMRCRGFDGRFRSLTHFRTSARDVTAFVLLALAAAALLWWDRVS